MLSDGERRKSVLVRRLVALAYLPAPRDPHQIEVTNIDGDRENNRWRNLQWASHSETRLLGQSRRDAVTSRLIT